MAMSDCPKCWETPCCCGYEYRKYSDGNKIELASVVLNIPKDIIEDFYNNYKNIKLTNND